MNTVIDQGDAATDEVVADKPVVEDKAAVVADKAADKPVVDDKDKGVPLAALHEAREETRALKAQIKELEGQPRLSKEDQELLADLKVQRSAAKEPKDPDFLEDPKGYIDAKERRASDALKKLESGQAELNQSAAQQREFTQLMNTVQQQESKFVGETPDYYDALKFLRSKRVEQLQLIYPDATDEQISATLSQEEISAAAQALRNRKNPGEVAYKYAKTMGYAPPKAQDDKKANGADRAAARSLGGSGGGVVEDPADTEDTMPDFTAALKERFGKARR